MQDYQKLYAYHEKYDGQYELKSYWTSSQTVEFDDGQTLEEYKTELSSAIDSKGDEIDYSLDDGEVYLYSNGRKIATEEMSIRVAPNIQLDDIYNLSIRLYHGNVRFTWRDPSDVVFSELPLVEWDGTKVVRKIGSAPNNVNDGTLVLDSKERDAYSSTPYYDEGLVSGRYYYYRFFPYDKDGNYYGRTCGVVYKSIVLIPTAIPYLTDIYTYTGENITPEFTNYDKNTMTRSGTVYAKNAGTYTTTFTLKEGYKWSDDTVEPKSVEWEIRPVEINVAPSWSGTLTYNGSAQAPTWSNYDSDQLTKTETAQTNAGSYSTTFTPKNNYVWSDGTSVAKTVQWSIGKAEGYIELNESDIMVYKQTSHITEIVDSSGVVEIQSFDPSIINVKIESNEIIIDCDLIINTETTLSLYISESSNYLPTTKIVNVIVKNKLVDTWNKKTWNGLTNYLGLDVWTDGNNIYYSSTNKNYVLDKETSTWNVKTWNGLTSFLGRRVWSDGENIYYSYNSNQYVLNKNTSTWDVKTWEGYNYLDGQCVWFDDGNIYYSNSSNQYILDKSTSTWTQKTWNGMSSFYGYSVWTDGENIYYSRYRDDHVLDKTTDTWITKTWNVRLDYGEIWTDGEDIYYSRDGNNYVLNKETSSWDTKTWKGLTNFSASYIWTDGEHIYYSNSSNQYILDN